MTLAASVKGGDNSATAYEEAVKRKNVVESFKENVKKDWATLCRGESSLTGAGYEFKRRNGDVVLSPLRTVLTLLLLDGITLTQHLW